MAHISVTRLRLRSGWFFLPFIWHALRSRSQARIADGNLRADADRRNGAWWTVTVWRDRGAMRAFMLNGAHKRAMPHLQHWCDEASLVGWEGDVSADWDEAERRLAREGRVSTVRHPSPAHAAGHTLGSSPRAAMQAHGAAS